jgi:hypothetical protein
MEGFAWPEPVEGLRQKLFSSANQPAGTPAATCASHSLSSKVAGRNRECHRTLIGRLLVVPFRAFASASYELIYSHDDDDNRFT